jgi:hypothetical protein
MLEYRPRHRSTATEKGRVMAHPHAFDPHTFLAKVGTGRTLVSYQEQRSIFAQGEAADAVSGEFLSE